MAEMSDLASALDKLEVTKKGKESPPDSSEQQAKEASPQASSSSPPASAEKQEEKKSETSPPASTEKQEEKKKTEDSPQPHQEEATLKVSSSVAAKDPSPPESKQPEDSKDPSPPKPKQSEDSQDPSPPESKPQDPAEEDLLEFTSATEGEGEASSSACELVPERKIARKKGVKSDSEIDTLVKKVIKEAEQQAPVTSDKLTSDKVTSSSSTTAKDVVASIAEDPAAEAAAEAQGDEAEEAAAAAKANWEPDFSFEDAPVPPSKDVLTTKLGRKNLMTSGVTADDEDSEMADADTAAASHLGSSSKRKGRSSSQGAAKKRALPPKSPRTSSVGAKAKSPPTIRPASANKMPRSASPQGKAESKVAGKPAVKPPPKGLTPLSGAHAVAKPPPKAVTTPAAAAKEAKAWEDWEKAKAKVAERERLEASAPKSPPLFAPEWQ